VSILSKNVFYLPAVGCRICKSTIELIHNLGTLSSSGTFPSTRAEIVPEGPLEIGRCVSCGLVQLKHDFNKSILYSDSYGYRSSLQESMVTHLQGIADSASKRIKTSFPEKSSDSTFVDIGSNDATLLKQMKKIHGDHGRYLGVDPSAEKYTELYRDSGIELFAELFDSQTAKNRLGAISADVVTSIAMFYDLEDPVDFALAVSEILNENGIWILEQSYLPDMILNNAFDTICHEHLEYYSLTDISNICERAGLRVFDVEMNNSNGGSFRTFVCHQGNELYPTAPIVNEILFKEDSALSIDNELEEFFVKISDIKRQTLAELRGLASSGKIVHGYGASTKGNTLLQYFGIDESLMPFIAERNPDKYGKFTPGTKIPIISESESRDMKPDYYFVLPWHFRESILARESQFSDSRRFIFPLPVFEIV